MARGCRRGLCWEGTLALESMRRLSIGRLTNPWIFHDRPRRMLAVGTEDPVPPQNASTTSKRLFWCTGGRARQPTAQSLPPTLTATRCPHPWVRGATFQRLAREGVTDASLWRTLRARSSASAGTSARFSASAVNHFARDRVAMLGARVELEPMWRFEALELSATLSQDTRTG